MHMVRWESRCNLTQFIDDDKSFSMQIENDNYKENSTARCYRKKREN